MFSLCVCPGSRILIWGFWSDPQPIFLASRIRILNFLDGRFRIRSIPIRNRYPWFGKFLRSLRNLATNPRFVVNSLYFCDSAHAWQPESLSKLQFLIRNWSQDGQIPTIYYKSWTKRIFTSISLDL